jgi:hypothetical protein
MTKSNLKSRSKSRSKSVVQKRTKVCLTRELEEKIQMISISGGANIVGSYSYMAHPYPGDIDMFEKVEKYQKISKLSPEQVYSKKIELVKDLEKKFMKIGKQIQKQRETYLADFKAGYDFRYLLNLYDVNEELNPLICLNQWLTVSQSEGLYRIKELYKQKLLSVKEYQNWKKDFSYSREYFIENCVRKNWIIRWSLSELINGTKFLPLKKEITLREALTHQSVVKIDLITEINGFFNGFC